ncbi:amino acid transporter [Streptococcus pluranimalium]|uniref:Amino acid transporter n=1 Tax=Streptococcus acidominimus TaxID=1326 RepID=A0A239XL01_STRAI|nr:MULTISPECIES: amino acid transporter [Streptococcus]SNV47621.1 amino acid transporter [Streptococcus acidominimus]
MLKSVFKTIFSRRDTKIFLSFCFLPIIVPFLSGNLEALDVEYTKSFLSFLETTLLTQYRLTLPVLIFSIVISSTFRDEIDSGIMFLYKDIQRSKIFNSKIFGLTLIYGIYLLSTLLITLITYYGLMLPKFGVSMNLFPNVHLVFEQSFLTILATILLNLITIVIVVMVSVRSKTLAAVLSGVFFVLFTVTGTLLVGIKYLVPLTYSNFVSSSGFVTSLLLILIISTIYYLVCYFIAKNRFKKVEF